jgi:AcrR family transcriptional regulator
VPPIPPTPELELAAARLLLAEGMAALTFGRLSRETGVSDRMLVYRFGTKAVLLERALDVVVAGIRAELAGLVDEPPVTPASVLHRAAEAMRSGDRAPVLSTWFEVLAAATRGDATCAAAAERIARGWYEWLVEVLATEPDPRLSATEVLARLEGVLVLHAAGLGAEADAALSP